MAIPKNVEAPIIVWFRQDLRLEDNPAFSAACEKKCPVIPVYLWSPEEEGRWRLGGASKWWLHHSLEMLEKDLQRHGLRLVIRTGSSLACLQGLIGESGAHTVYWNRRYEPASLLRDTEVKKALCDLHVDAKSFNANLLFEPWTIANKQGKPFQVFTPFWKCCLTYPEPALPLPEPKPVIFENKLKSIPLRELDLLPGIPWDKGIKQRWTPGTSAAKQILKDFLDGPIHSYKDERDFPAHPGVSTLSPYLHFGEISPRMIWHAVRQAKLTGEGPECFLKQLGWREFAHHLLYHFPKTPEKPLHSKFETFAWDHNAHYLSSWQKGLTGYPIVDAGMRELWQTGYMHNRIRMVVGSFLVKDLLISWVEGALWFWDTLVDADLANNTLGWQWVGGCGADAAPYFRVFNPVTQGEKFDGQGAYVRQWIPELQHVPDEWIQRPWEAPEMLLRQWGVILGKDYPWPIVDHKAAREKALQVFKSL